MTSILTQPIMIDMGYSAMIDVEVRSNFALTRHSHSLPSCASYGVSQWLSAKLWYIQCISNTDTTVLYLAINLLWELSKENKTSGVQCKFLSLTIELIKLMALFVKPAITPLLMGLSYPNLKPSKCWFLCGGFVEKVTVWCYVTKAARDTTYRWVNARKL